MSDPVTWSVVAQSETSGQDANGNYVAGVQVTFRLSTGTTGSVFIPEQMYSAKYAAAAIAKAAAEVHATGNLAGTIET